MRPGRRVFRGPCARCCTGRSSLARASMSRPSLRSETGRRRRRETARGTEAGGGEATSRPCVRAPSSTGPGTGSGSRPRRSRSTASFPATPSTSRICWRVMPTPTPTSPGAWYVRWPAGTTSMPPAANAASPFRPGWVRRRRRRSPRPNRTSGTGRAGTASCNAKRKGSAPWNASCTRRKLRTARRLSWRRPSSSWKSAANGPGSNGAMRRFPRTWSASPAPRPKRWSVWAASGGVRSATLPGRRPIAARPNARSPRPGLPGARSTRAGPRTRALGLPGWSTWKASSRACGGGRMRRRRRATGRLASWAASPARVFDSARRRSMPRTRRSTRSASSRPSFASSMPS